MNKFFIFIKILVLLFFIFQIHFHQRKQKIIINKNHKNQIIPEPFKMGNCSLFNPLNNPMISIIFDLGKLELEYFSFKNYIFSFLKQTIKDIEIILYFYHKDVFNKSLISSISTIDKRISIYISKKKNKISNIIKITNMIKGKFILIIQQFIKLKNNELSFFYNFTKGKIDNIFNITVQNTNELYLIRTKILRDIFDNEIKFKDYDEIINYIGSMSKPKLTYIPISLSPNDKYAPLAYTSMFSILNSKNYLTFINFYLIIPKNFSKFNYNLIDSLFEQFNYFNITYIIMDERYKNAFVHKYITNQAYYRFSLGRLLPNLNKIIYLDADTIVFKDLTNFFDLNFKGKIFLGKGLSRNKTLEKQIKINSGVLLLNLKKMRKLDIEKKVLKILNSGFTHPTLHDQAIIEIYLYKYVGLISPEYNSYFLNYTETLNLIRNPKLYNKDELIYSLKYPTIRHYKGDKKNLNDDWFFFARKSKYFSRKTNNYSHVFKISS